MELWMKVLELDDLYVTFKQKNGTVQAVRGVSFSVDTKGQSVGIVGESGSGKSVSSLALLGLLKAPQAQVSMASYRFDGIELSSADAKTMQGIRGSRISMIFQEPMTSLDPVFRIGEQMTETIRTHQGLDRKRAWALGTDMLGEVEIRDPDKAMRSYPHQLSGGMRQRVMIAMALSCKPSLLIADEPTTALDVTVQAQVLKLIKKLQKDLGMALLLITHDLGVIAETTDKVVVMYGGKVLESAGVFDLFDHPAQPYTRALIKSIPDIGRPRTEKLYTIQGSSPSPLDPPAGCPFHERCPEKMDKCASAFPPVTVLGDGHEACCWRLS